MRQFADWLANSSASLFIQSADWIVPTVQTVHILAIALVMGSVLMVELRILGLAARTQTLHQTARRYTPWIWGALAVLFTTGCLMIIGEPVRELMNVVFWSKMALIVVASLVTLAFQATVRRAASKGEEAALGARRGLHVAALLTLGVWCAIVILGRWIAYAQTVY